MQSLFWVTIAIVSIVVLLIDCVASSKVDLFISKEEINRTLGLHAVVHYVENGKINEYALQFPVLVRPNISHLNFFWRNNADYNVFYKMDVVVDENGMVETSNSIPWQGTIPQKLSFFTIGMKCTGRKKGAVVIKIRLNYSNPDYDERQSQVVLQRKKICLKTLPKITGAMNDGFHNDQGVNVQPETTGELNDAKYVPPGFTISASQVFYIAIGCLCGFIIVLASLVVAYFVRVKSLDASMCSRTFFEPRHYSVQVASPGMSAQTQPFLRPESPSTLSKYSALTGNQSTSMYSGSVPIRRPSPASSTTQLLYVEQRPVDVGGVIPSLLVNKEMVELGDIIQEGTFGEILSGSYRIPNNMESQGSLESGVSDSTTIPILIKTIKKKASESQRSKFLEEGLNYQSLTPHPNVSKVIAIFLHSPADSENGSNHSNSNWRLNQQPTAEAVFLCYAHGGYGNLKKFLLRCRGVEQGSVQSSLRTQDVVYMGLQIIRGMQHLHRHRILHRDLAARNCLISEDLRVEICDTALSRDLFPQDYHCLGDNENRPMKWLSLETLDRGEMSSASDVWAFGVTMWELLTCGLQPYMDVDPEEIHRHLKEGFRLQQPYYCPDELYGVIFCCWGAHPVSRPSFDQLLIALEDFYTQLTEYI